MPSHKTYPNYNYMMAKWIKTACAHSFEYGLDKINKVVTSTMTLIFNMYCNKLFQIGGDNIVEKSSTTGDHSVFHLAPIILNESSEESPLGTLVMKSGYLIGICIKVPWKSVFVAACTISIDSIHINAEIDNIELSSDNNIDLSQSCYIGVTRSDVHVHLIESMSEIKKILLDRFFAIDFMCKQIVIDFDTFAIYIKDASYSSNVLSIKTIEIISKIKLSDGESHEPESIVSVSNINVSFAPLSISIGKIDISIDTESVLPTLIIRQKESDLNMTLYIDTLNYSNIFTMRHVMVNCHGCTLSLELDDIKIPGILSISHSRRIHIEINTSGNIINLDGTFVFQIHDIDKLRGLFGTISKDIRYIMDHFKNTPDCVFPLVIPDSPPPSLFTLKNLRIKIYINEESFDMQADSVIIIRSGVTLSNINIIYDGSSITADIFRYDHNLINIDTFRMVHSKYCFVAEKIQRSTGKKFFDIIFVGAICTGIDSLMHHVQNMLSRFKNNIPLKGNECGTNISVSRSVIISTIRDITAKFNIDKCAIKLPDIVINDLTGTASINDIAIINIGADFISKKKMSVKKLEFFLDSSMIDTLRTLFTEMHNNKSPPTDVMKETMVELSYSIKMSYRAICEELLIDRTCGSVNENGQCIQKYVPNINVNIIDNYARSSKPMDMELDINIDNINIYLSVKLVTGLQKKSDSLYCMIMKEIKFTEKKLYNSRPKIKSISQDIVNTVSSTEYNIKVSNVTMIDMTCHDPEWKYIIKCNDSHFLDLVILSNNMMCEISSRIGKFSVNIKGETLSKISRFIPVSTMKKTTDANISIKSCDIQEINVVVNYFPSVLKDTDIFALRNYKLKLESLFLYDIDSVDRLLQMIQKGWSNSLSIYNIANIVPSISFVEKCTSPILGFIKDTSRNIPTKDLVTLMDDGRHAISKIIAYGTAVISIISSHK